MTDRSTSNACAMCGFVNGSVVREWSFFLPLEPPTQNDIAQNSGGRRHAYRRVRDQFTFLVNAEMHRLSIPKATERRIVTVTRLYTGRGKERDYGNLVGGCKPLLDAMARVGIIVDDAPAWVGDYYQQRRAEKSGAEVRVQEVA